MPTVVKGVANRPSADTLFFSEKHGFDAVNTAVLRFSVAGVPVVHGVGCSVHPRSAAHGLPVTFQVACKRAVFG